jgi:replicative DNA helicase
VIVDYIQLVRGDGRYTSANNEVNDITRAFKAYALSANVPVLALSQLNRASSRENRRPQLHDLRDSGGIEQDADVVMFIHDPEIEENIRELIIDKNRAGRLGSIKLKFIPEQIRFESIGEIEFANDHNSQPALGANGD